MVVLNVLPLTAKCTMATRSHTLRILRLTLCNNLHVTCDIAVRRNMEGRAQLCQRLSDWDSLHWRLFGRVGGSPVLVRQGAVQRCSCSPHQPFLRLRPRPRRRSLLALPASLSACLMAVVRQMTLPLRQYFICKRHVMMCCCTVLDYYITCFAS